MIDFENAACTEEDTDLFFPEGKDIQGKIALAKAICASCPIAVQCLNMALAEDAEGVWGGTTTDERKRFKRRGVIVTNQRNRH
jgi:WhiB family redox-sensing transcriptional regulator